MRRFRVRLIQAGAVLLCAVSLIFVVLALMDAELSSPFPSRLLLDREGQFLSQIKCFSTGDYGYWPLKALPRRVVAAFLALEDQRFWHHPGVDPVAVCRALWQNISSGRRISGASTIAMQVARLQHPGPRTYLRKTVEALTAVFLTARYGRENLLKHYLTIVPFGNNGHGIRYAARLYLNKPVDDLSWAEIAFLSSIPHAPTRMNPYHPGGPWRCRKRGLQILEALYQKGEMTHSEWELAIAQIRRLQIDDPVRRPSNAMHAILHMVSLLKKGGADVAATRSQAPLIKTTIDSRLQEKVNTIASRRLDQWRPQGADQVAVIVTRLPQMEVLAYVGSRDYFESEAGSMDFADVKRSSGSTLKPFIYALALERGNITPTTILDDLPLYARGFQNADNQFLGPLLPRQALANSRNVTAVSLLNKIGLDETYLYLKMLGLHDNQMAAGHYGLGMAVGSLPVDLLSLVRAYGVLANQGAAARLTWFKTAGAATNPAPGRRQLISREYARLITLFLSDPMARLPGFPRMGTTEYPFAVALKTGTAKGCRDAWTIAYSNKYLVGVWIGRADDKPMHKLSGAGSAAVVVKDILMYLHRGRGNGLDEGSFPPPEGFTPVEVCSLTGQRNQGDCERTFLEWVPPAQLPEKDQAHHRLPVDSRNGLLAGPWTPERFIKNEFFVDLAPPYREWARAHSIKPLPAAYSLLDLPGNTLQHTQLKAPRNYVLKGNTPVSITIHSPMDGVKIRPNLNLPAAMNSIGLKVSADPEVDQVVWYVDGRPFKLCSPSKDLRWPLVRGAHTFQVRLPFREEFSKVIAIEVQ